MNDKHSHLIHLAVTGLIGDAGIAAFQAPDPNMIQQYGSLILQSIVTVFTVIAAWKKLRQTPKVVVPSDENATES